MEIRQRTIRRNFKKVITSRVAIPYTMQHRMKKYYLQGKEISEKQGKRRFAWIKAGRITDEQFYAWSEKAREEKKKCDREIISLEEFQQWLRDSKI